MCVLLSTLFDIFMKITLGNKFISIQLFIESISFGMKVIFTIVDQNTSILFCNAKIIE